MTTMRVLFIQRASDLKALSTMLAGRRSTGLSSSALDRLKALNPHVDFDHVEAGTVLMLPDAPEFRAEDGQGRSVGDEAFEHLVEHIEQGFETAVARVSKVADVLAAESKSIGAAVKTPALKRLLETDPVFKRQLAEAGDAANAELKAVGHAATQLKAMRKEAAEELAALRQLLG
jgi:hypothetical protein